MSDERKNNISEKEKEDILEIYKQCLKKSYKLKENIIKSIKIITLSMGIIVGVVVILSLIIIKLIHIKICIWIILSIWIILIGFVILIIAISNKALKTITEIMDKKYEVIEELVKEAYGISDGQA